MDLLPFCFPYRKHKDQRKRFLSFLFPPFFCLGDPTVNYDQFSQRWIIAQFTASAPYGQCVAVSTGPDPTGTYYRYFFSVSDCLCVSSPSILFLLLFFFFLAHVIRTRPALEYSALRLPQGRHLGRHPFVHLQQVRPKQLYVNPFAHDNSTH